MASIIYMASDSNSQSRFTALLASMIPGRTFEICHTATSLSQRLRKPHANIRVVVLFGVSGADITNILLFEDLITDLKSMIVLTDDDKETVAKAHTLLPRFMTCIDTDFGQIVSVLRNMIDLYDAPTGSRRRSRNERKPAEAV